jgi:tetratricopeptide (TPR) repeat protein
LRAPNSWPAALVAALETARGQGRPLHLHLTRPDVPVAPAMAETLKVAPVRQLLVAHFVDLRLDSREHAALFRGLIGARGALGSCIIDLDAAGRPDVVGVISGYVDADRYVAFLDGAARNLPRLRQLRDGPRQSNMQLELAERYAAQGGVVRARAELEAVTDANARPAALEHLARLDIEAGQTARARGKLEQARALRPAWPSSRWSLTEALVLSAERRVTEAVSLLGVGLAVPTDPHEQAQSLLLLGQLEHELNRDQQALAHLERLRTESFDPTWARRASESIAHIRNPAPDHRH